MKILVFEYISGGGFNQQLLPDSLAREGQLMLQALLDNFSRLKDVTVVVMLDYRFVDVISTQGIKTVIVTPVHDVKQEFMRLAQETDAVWPVAPEFSGILQSLCQSVTDLHKILLTSPADAVAITANKYTTYQQLIKHGINTVPTRLLANTHYETGEWIVKAIDGVGCEDSYVLDNESDYAKLASNADGYIIQPHLQGNKTSLSCLFKQGDAWLLSVNWQHFDIIERQYQLTKIMVNNQPYSDVYQKLSDEIAKAFPNLWGYVGVDLIETENQILVLEINPRLTTSFTGIYAALGINVAEQVMQLLGGAPDILTKINQSITINLLQ
jgi:predicted ATP-grasp superfamily ATP-dependent carboligase